MIDWLMRYWNDAVTLFTFAATLLIGYYQIQHYRAQYADLNIVTVEDASYVARRQDGGRIKAVDPDEHDEVHQTKYSLSVLVENDGREPTTISEITLILPDTGEELEMYNERGRRGWTRSFVEFDKNERQNLNLFVGGEVLDEYGRDLEAVLRLDSTAGVIEKRITLEYGR